MVGSFSTRGRQYTGTGTFFILLSSWPPLGLSCNHRQKCRGHEAWGGSGAWTAVQLPIPSELGLRLWPRPVPPPLHTRSAPRSTCLYLAGRLQPQACSRPSSLRTCSRTWRYCSRFCSRLAEEVQSLGGENHRVHSVFGACREHPKPRELSLLDLSCLFLAPAPVGYPSDERVAFPSTGLGDHTQHLPTSSWPSCCPRH